MPSKKEVNDWLFELRFVNAQFLRDNLRKDDHYALFMFLKWLESRCVESTSQFIAACMTETKKPDNKPPAR